MDGAPWPDPALGGVGQRVRSAVERRIVGDDADAADLDYHGFHRRQVRLLHLVPSNEEAVNMMTHALQLPCLALASRHPVALIRGDAGTDVRALMRVRLESSSRLTPYVRGEHALDPRW